MPRPKVTEELRRRVAKACIACQSTKQKCDGGAPCAPCSKRGQSATCHYSPHERSYGARRRRRRRDAEESRRPSSSADSVTPPTIAMNDTSPGQLQANLTDSPTAGIEINVPKLSRTLHDTKGRVMYLGDCAALSFLQHIQDLIESEGGPSVATADGSNVSAMEEAQPQQGDVAPTESLESFDGLEDLIHVFFAATCGILDIVSREHVLGLLNQWENDPRHTSNAGKAVLFVIIAFAAQARGDDIADHQRAQYYFHHGRQTALLHLTDEPSLETVQAFVIMHLYLLATSRRNAAYLNLGIAISAAKALGLHRTDPNADQNKSTSYLRTRIWRTICYHDLHFCAMMGRTPSTTTTDSAQSIFESSPSSSSPEDFGQESAMLESARAFSIMQRTVTEIYTKRTVSLGLLQHLAQDLQHASSNVPIELQTVEPAGPHVRQCILRNAVVACSYYFSMLVLTRPFLITTVQTKLSRARAARSGNGQDDGAEDGGQIQSEIMQGAIASIDAATYTIRLLHELLTANLLFNNMPLAIAWVFVSALTVCSAYFGRIGNNHETERAIQQADEILAHFAKHSKQGKRYGLILKKLSNAAVGYLQGLERRHRPPPPTIRMPEMFRLGLPKAESLYTRSGFPGADYTQGDGRESTLESEVGHRQPHLRAAGTGPFTPSNHADRREAAQMSNTSSTYIPETQDAPGRTSHHHHHHQHMESRDTSSTIHSASLLDLAQSFNDMSNATGHAASGPGLTSTSFEGYYFDDFHVDLERAGDIWDLDWGDALL